MKNITTNVEQEKSSRAYDCTHANKHTIMSEQRLCVVVAGGSYFFALLKNFRESDSLNLYAYVRARTSLNFC